MAQMKMTGVIIALLLGALPLLAHAAEAAQPEPIAEDVVVIAQDEPTENTFPPEDWRGFRFCEVMVVTRSGMTASINIYNTVGLSDCPEEAWTSLDADVLAQANNALAVALNGPRYWMVNEINGSAEDVAGGTTTFGDLEMRQVTELSLPIRQIRDMQSVYTERDFEADTSFTYQAENRVYELVSPDGATYRMQVFSQAVDPTLSIEGPSCRKFELVSE